MRSRRRSHSATSYGATKSSRRKFSIRALASSSCYRRKGKRSFILENKKRARVNRVFAGRVYASHRFFLLLFVHLLISTRREPADEVGEKFNLTCALTSRIRAGVRVEGRGTIRKERLRQFEIPFKPSRHFGQSDLLADGGGTSRDKFHRTCRRGRSTAHLAWPAHRSLLPHLLRPSLFFFIITRLFSIRGRRARPSSRRLCLTGGLCSLPGRLHKAGNRLKLGSRPAQNRDRIETLHSRRKPFIGRNRAPYPLIHVRVQVAGLSFLPLSLSFAAPLFLIFLTTSTR